MQKREVVGVVQPRNLFLRYYYYGREVFIGDGPLDDATRDDLAVAVVPV